MWTFQTSTQVLRTIHFLQVWKLNNIVSHLNWWNVKWCLCSFYIFEFQRKFWPEILSTWHVWCEIAMRRGNGSLSNMQWSMQRGNVYEEICSPLVVYRLWRHIFVVHVPVTSCRKWLADTLVVEHVVNLASVFNVMRKNSTIKTCIKMKKMCPGKLNNLV